MAKDKTTECLPLNKDDIGFRKNKKGMGSYAAKKEEPNNYPGSHRTSPGRYGSVKFE